MQMAAQVQADRILRRPEVRFRVGLSDSQIYSLVSEGKFPAQVKLAEGGRAVGWRESDIAAWIASRQTAGSAK